jgi:hypothetical protein
METKKGTYGSNYTPCDVFIYNNWYVVNGGTIVNLAPDSSYFENEPINVEEIPNIDCFTWNKPITSVEELQEAVEA